MEQGMLNNGQRQQLEGIAALGRNEDTYLAHVAPDEMVVPAQALRDNPLLKQAIEKAKSFGFSLENSVMASDAFFPFPDCVEIAFNEGICSVIQPGGSIKDQLSVDFCDANKMSMVFSGIRHFKH